MEPILPARIPFVRLDTISGYVLYCILHMGWLFVAVSGTTASDILLIVLTLHVWPMITIFNQAVINLNQATGGVQHEAIKHSTWLHAQIRNIVNMHKEIYL